MHIPWVYFTCLTREEFEKWKGRGEPQWSPLEEALKRLLVQLAEVALWFCHNFFGFATLWPTGNARFGRWMCCRLVKSAIWYKYDINTIYMHTVAVDCRRSGSATRCETNGQTPTRDNATRCNNSATQSAVVKPISCWVVKPKLTWERHLLFSVKLW